MQKWLVSSEKSIFLYEFTKNCFTGTASGSVICERNIEKVLFLFDASAFCKTFQDLSKISSVFNKALS